jgi:hypothetical protein
MQARLAEYSAATPALHPSLAQRYAERVATLRPPGRR